MEKDPMLDDVKDGGTSEQNSTNIEKVLSQLIQTENLDDPKIERLLTELLKDSYIENPEIGNNLLAKWIKKKEAKIEDPYDYNSKINLDLKLANIYLEAGYKYRSNAFTKFEDAKINARNANNPELYEEIKNEIEKTEMGFLIADNKEIVEKMDKEDAKHAL